ncbi:hypothetical protein M404DRAFT_34604 [Pisolithus tinctorius Marx 270]|uniref:Uncharacterized protein n=1 Tax=Pisolithus tinctorius Marx 270 TaxID=870435 RepID=A0A0C3NGS0_PISTI|nr:hypothetical protein M404DRAFT_34604 [Pisolithus tinctorius Marx 270]
MDIKFIGSGTAAKALTYYISDYITKNDLQVHVGLQAIRTAIDSHHKLFINNIETPSSVCEQNLLTKTVNAMMGRREVSHQQVMSYLVGGGDFYTSHEFRIVRFHEFVDIVIAHELHVDGDCNCMGEELTDCPGNLYGSTCTAHTSDGLLSVVLELQDYLMCPSVPPFEAMCLWQFLEQTQKVKRTSSSMNSLQEQCNACEDAAAWSGSERPAYSCRFRAPFTDHAHPQFNTHDLCIQNTFVVPVLLGDSIPLPRKSDFRMEDFCRAMLLLFHAWRKPSDLLENYSCWTEAFDAYQFSDNASRIISNFLIELESKPSSDLYLNKPNEFDVELLREVLILDSELDLAEESDSEGFDSDHLDGHGRGALPVDEQDIIVMSRALHRDHKHAEEPSAIEGRVIERKRKRPQRTVHEDDIDIVVSSSHKQPFVLREPLSTKITRTPCWKYRLRCFSFTNYPLPGTMDVPYASGGQCREYHDALVPVLDESYTLFEIFCSRNIGRRNYLWFPFPYSCATEWLGFANPNGLHDMGWSFLSYHYFPELHFDLLELNVARNSRTASWRYAEKGTEPQPKIWRNPRGPACKRYRLPRPSQKARAERKAKAARALLRNPFNPGLLDPVQSFLYDHLILDIY